LGRRFVTLEIKLFLAIFLTHYDFELTNQTSGEGIHRDPKQVFFTARPKNAVIVKYKKR